MKAICLWPPERLSCFGVGCPFVCRDECLAVAMIAACQHDDATYLDYCAAGLGGPAGRSHVIEAGTGFALHLRGSGQVLLPVPHAVVRGLVDDPPSTSYH